MALLTHQAHRVYTRDNWADAWVVQDHLYANTVIEAASPAISRAELFWRFGDVQQFGKRSSEDVSKLQLLDSYVKVEIDQPDDDNGDAVTARPWYGIVTDDRIEFDGDDNGLLQSGRQVIIAQGLEHLLTRKILDASIVRTTTGEKDIGRAIGFNLGTGQPTSHVREGNAWGADFQGDEFTKSGRAGTAIFAELLGFDNAVLWSSFRIIEYLLINHAPIDSRGRSRIKWELPPDLEIRSLIVTKPSFHAHGKTIKQILDILIDRRRLLGWKINVLDNLDENGNATGVNETLQVVVFKFNESRIRTADGNILPANANQSTWDFEGDATIRAALLSRSIAQTFDRVIARGERRGAVFTIANSDSTLEADWASALATAYNAGGTGGSDRKSKQDINKLYRRSDKFKRVYRYFRVPVAWSGLVNSGAEAVLPFVDGRQVEDPAIAQAAWNAGLRFEPLLPLKSDRDYSGTKIADNTVTDATPSGSQAEFLRPFAVIPDGAKYSFIDRMSEGDTYDTQVESRGREWSASLRMQDDQLGIICDVHGSMQHAIAVDEFTAADADDAADFKDDLDWKDMQCTVYMLGDDQAEQYWPDPVGAFGNLDTIKVLVIHVPGARLDYVANTTVVGVASDGTLITSSGGWLNDDRVLLRNTARIAYDWYNGQRQAISVLVHDMAPQFNVGDLITQIGGSLTPDIINSVVTSITFDLQAGSHRVQTEFAELDAVGL